MVFGFATMASYAQPAPGVDDVKGEVDRAKRANGDPFAKSVQKASGTTAGDWIVLPGDDGSIKFHDKEPPDDDCTLAMSIMRLPPGDWSGLKLSLLVEKLVEKDSRGATLRGKIIDVPRTDLDLTWAEVEFIDPNEKRPARSRTCLARASNIQTLITFDFWEDQAAVLGKVWDEILRSLRVAEPILDPRLGQPNRG